MEEVNAYIKTGFVDDISTITISSCPDIISEYDDTIEEAISVIKEFFPQFDVNELGDGVYEVSDSETEEFLDEVELEVYESCLINYRGFKPLNFNPYNV